jgi:hypothetical protein
MLDDTSKVQHARTLGILGVCFFSGFGVSVLSFSLKYGRIDRERDPAATYEGEGYKYCTVPRYI